MNPNSSGIGSALGSVLKVLKANGPYLDEYKRNGGDTTPGVAATLSNGVQGHFTEQGLFQIDYTPPEFSAWAQAQPDVVAPPPTSYAPPPPAPSTYRPPSPFAPPASAPPMSIAAPAAGGLAARGPLGLPVLAWVGVGGLALFLIARRL